MIFFKPKPLYSPSELLVYNPTGEFGNKNDLLFHVRTRRYGRCSEISEKQWWYSGSLLELRKSKSKGLPQVPFFSTGILNIKEGNLKKLEELIE